MIKRILSIILCIILLLQFPATMAKAEPMPSLKATYDEFVNISITAGSRDFYVYELKKQFSAVPFIEGTVTYSQADSILPWIGCTVSYDAKSKILTAKSPTYTCIIKADNQAYTLNGRTLKFTRPPKVVSGKLMVPTGELFRALGFTVQQDNLLKKVCITKFKDYSMGNFIFYSNSVDQFNLYRMDKTGVYNENFKNITVNQVYSREGVIISYVYDRQDRQNKLVKYEQGKLVDLKDNFDIVNTYEFGNNRVFYGYDNGDKKYKLYRFDGKNLILVAGDCYSSLQINFKDSIILNSYDSSRNYTIIKINQNWNTEELDNKKAMVEYSINGECLYIKTKPQEGTGWYLLVYDGNKFIKAKVTNNLSKPVQSIDLKDVRVCEGKVYAILPDNRSRRKLYRLEEKYAVKAFDREENSNVVLMESYHEKFYLTLSIRTGSATQYYTYEYSPRGTSTLVRNNEFKDRNLKFEKSLVSNDTLFLIGKMGKNVDVPNEDIMYVYRSGVWNYTMDIKSIEAIIEANKKLYVNVKEYDRTTSNAQRNSALYIDEKGNISNAIINFNITNQSVLGSSWVFAGDNKITKRSGVNIHNSTCNELISGFSVTYWEPMKDRIFAGGKQDAMFALYSITENAGKPLRENFETKAVLATRNPNLYLIYGIEHEKESVYNNSKVLYLYNMQNGTFTLVNAGIDIKQIYMCN